METITQARVYAGTYAKYNEGSIYGEWLTLSDYNDYEEFYAACKDLHKDELEIELMFQDWENIPSDLVGESWLSENIFDIIKAVSELDPRTQEAFHVWLNNSGEEISEQNIEDLISRFEDDYIGAYESEHDFAYEMMEDIDLPEIARNYFDYDSYARDLFMDGYWFDSGFVFYRN